MNAIRIFKEWFEFFENLTTHKSLIFLYFKIFNLKKSVFRPIRAMMKIAYLEQKELQF